MRSRPKGPITDGARKTLAFLAVRRLSIPAFCEAKGLPRLAVQRALNGTHTRRGILIDFAVSMRDATEGEVAVIDWSSKTLAEGARPRKRRLLPKKPDDPSPIQAAASGGAPLTLPSRPLTDGGRKTLAWLRDQGLSIAAFCDRNRKISKHVVFDALSGRPKPQGYTVDFGIQMEVATEGAAEVLDWRSATLASGARLRRGPPRGRSPIALVDRPRKRAAARRSRSRW